MTAVLTTLTAKLTPNQAWDLETAIKGAGEANLTFECQVTGRVGDGIIGDRSSARARSNVWQIVAKIGSEEIILYTRNPDLKPPFIMALGSKVTIRAADMGIDQQGRRAFLVSNIV